MHSSNWWSELRNGMDIPGTVPPLPDASLSSTSGCSLACRKKVLFDSFSSVVEPSTAGQEVAGLNAPVYVSVFSWLEAVSTVEIF